MIDEQPSRVGVVEDGPNDEAANETAQDKVSSSFAESLASPIVTLVVGKGDEQTILSAHPALLCKSPYFVEACRVFVEDGSVRGPIRSSRE